MPRLFIHDARTGVGVLIDNLMLDFKPEADVIEFHIFPSIICFSASQEMYLSPFS